MPCRRAFVAREAQPRRPAGITRRREVVRLADYDPVTGRRPNGKRWDALRARVVAEESYCWICDDPVDKSLTGSAKMAPSVDHVIPLADGGAYWDRANCRLAHVSCNSKRGGQEAKKRMASLVNEIAALRQRVAELEEVAL